MLISPLELHQARVDSNDEPYERLVLWVDRGYLESLSSPHTSLTRCLSLIHIFYGAGHMVGNFQARPGH